mgnify:CR=1 FL=1
MVNVCKLNEQLLVQLCRHFPLNWSAVKCDPTQDQGRIYCLKALQQNIESHY